MPKVIKVIGSASNDGMDFYTDDGKIYPFVYSPCSVNDFILSIESEEDDLDPWDEQDISAEAHLEVAEAEDMEVLYEAEE